MKMTVKSAVTALFLTMLLGSCSLFPANQKTFSISGPWKVSHQDNDNFKTADFNDSSWETVSKLDNIDLGGSKYFWLRKTIDIPKELQNKEVYLAFDKSNTACKIYADGFLIGQRGNFPPYENIRIEKMTDVLIPLNCIHNGKVTVAIHYYSPGSRAEGLEISLHNSEAAYFTNFVRNTFNMSIFMYICILSIFMMFYSLNQFFTNRKNTAFLYFALSVFFIIFYFFDLGSDNIFISYNIHRPFVRACLPTSLMFLAMFLNRFFNRKRRNLTLGLTLGISAFSMIIYYIFMGNDKMMGTLFNLFLAVVFAVIIYGFITSIKGIKQKQPYAFMIFLGFFFGTSFAAHDIIYMVQGKYPFMWLQGFSFFFVDLFVFLTLNMQSTKMSKEVVKLVDETTKQKDLLKTVIDNAKSMAEESNEVAKSLNSSVNNVVTAADQTKLHVKDINDAIEKQTKIREETAVAVSKLTQFLTQMNNEFENETKAIAITASGTQEVIKGIVTVGDGINSAAEFSKDLTQLTQTGSQDMHKLMEVMETIQSSSKEILSIITTLDNFAQQTDLLSMNASIEAAHSGEAGKGFAVIAHEIKTLASQTSQWSAKIGEIITSVINEIENSVELSTKVNNALNKIEEGAFLSNQKVEAAAEGMKSQQTAGSEISMQSENLAQTSQKMQMEIANQSAFSSHVLGNMEELLEASKSVDEASRYISEGTVHLAEEAVKLNELSEKTAKAAKELLSIMETAL